MNSKSKFHGPQNVNFRWNFIIDSWMRASMKEGLREKGIDGGQGKKRERKRKRDTQNDRERQENDRWRDLYSRRGIQKIGSH